MTELWKANIRLSKAPWKSRRRREIPTFPQLQRRVVLLERKRTQKEKTEGRLHKKLDTAHRSPLRSRMYGYFTHGTVPPPHLFSSGFLALPDYLRRLPSPTHFRRRLLGHTIFVMLVVLHSRPSTDRASLAISLSLIGPLTSAPREDPVSPAGVKRCSSAPCRPQSPWYGG
jgi:hypothetical protein